MATATLPASLPMIDPDGIAPGVDRELDGKYGMLWFEGVFYAKPDLGHIKFPRLVAITFASKEVFVALDLVMGNQYVVDREKALSLGCRMQATFEERDPQIVLAAVRKIQQATAPQFAG